MVRVINWIYGLLLIYVALDAMFFGILPADMLPIIVVILGVLIFFTPIHKAPSVRGPRGFIASSPRGPFQWIRRWIFGAAVVILGLASSQWIGALNILSGATIYTWAGQGILILIGLVYLFSGTKTGAYQIGSY